ncbi:fatty acid hydroxylase [Arsukibacterium ikkense]|uniref:Fatty acid hydroxylase n=1 Tax=Arsukibacterium ikkense TaxID=336831 RepID=A0A0M2V2P8_9GAMM|nr:sterol desaturase family protein [Arsukibacterium ikkense]KKO44659.1 fatty acid hydroxylase [Arsukibacterium ikkense]
MKHLTTVAVKVLYLPALLIGGNGIAIYIVAAGYPKIWLIPLLLLLIGVSFLAERWVAYNQTFNIPQQDTARDVLHALNNELMNLIGLSLLPFIAGALTVVNWWPLEWPLAVQLLLAVIVADIGITLAHYASHRLTLLWKLHAVHHSVKRMYGFNGLMKHPLHQLLETIAGITPLLIVGIPQDVLILLTTAVIIQLLLQHSNVAYFAGPFKYILAINSVHRFHHLRTSAEGNVNFGLFTTLTDRVLGTAYFDFERVIGVDDLGIATEPDYPTRYLSQLLHPFRRI